MTTVLARIKDAAATVVVSLIPYWRIIFLVFSVAATFAWTNWYFSPSERLERLSARVLAAANSEATFDAAMRMRDALNGGLFGPSIVSSSCLLTTCKIQVVNHFYPVADSAEKNPKTWRVGIEVTLTRMALTLAPSRDHVS